MLKRLKNAHWATKVIQEPEDSGYTTKLLSRKSIKRFGKFVQWIVLLGSIPFNWDSKRGKMIPEERTWVRGYWKFVAVYQFLNTVYLLIILIMMALDKTIELTNVDFFSHFCLTISYIFNFTLSLSVYIKRDEIIAFLNQFIRVIYKLEGREMTKTRRPTKFERWLFVFPVLACMQIPMGFTIHLVRPFASIYMVTSFIDENNYNFGLHAISLVFETMLYTSQWFKAIFFIIYTYTYFIVTASWIKNLKKQLTKYPRLIELNRYRFLQLLNKQFNHSVSDLAMCGHKVVIAVLTVTTSYAIMHFYYLDIYTYSTYCIILAIMLIFQYIAYLPASSVYEISGKIHKLRLPKGISHEYQQKVLKSCAPLKIKVGPFYWFKHHTPLKFFKSECYYTMKIHYYILK